MTTGRKIKLGLRLKRGNVYSRGRYKQYRTCSCRFFLWTSSKRKEKKKRKKSTHNLRTHYLERGGIECSISQRPSKFKATVVDTQSNQSWGGRWKFGVCSVHNPHRLFSEERVEIDFTTVYPRRYSVVVAIIPLQISQEENYRVHHVVVVLLLLQCGSCDGW